MQYSQITLMEQESYAISLLSTLFSILPEQVISLLIQIIFNYQETMLCHSCNETMIAKRKKVRNNFLGKNMVQPWVAITYRLAAAHTRLREPLFPRHSLANWWSRRGGTWPGWSHSRLWCSHPHPAGHFCKTGDVASGDPSSARPGRLPFPLPSWLASKADAAEAPASRATGTVGIQPRWLGESTGPSYSCWQLTFRSLALGWLLSLIFSLTLRLF